MKTTLATILIALVLCVSAFAQDQTFHVVSVHKATDVEKSYKTEFAETLIIGTIGNKQYTLSELNSWGAFHYEVGQDYPVVQIKNGNPDTVKLTVPNKYDKHGKKPFTTDTLCVRTIEELPTK